jgi:hypothetical protein
MFVCPEFVVLQEVSKTIPIEQGRAIVHLLQTKIIKYEAINGTHRRTL